MKEERLEELPFPLNLLPQELQLQQQQQLLMYCMFSDQVKEESLEGCSYSNSNSALCTVCSLVR